ncbi:similarity to HYPOTHETICAL INTEGRAL MEMBRANE PROTEIN YG35_yeast [Encephalitozoon cuniculi GB-M1]|uniref:SLC26A/SulP transporter domain-containing protein n=2 Tax=Encephalitozoon cuniculi TaxID=6035 RepID=M1KIJ2_ENCCN|nr:Vsb1p-like protein [Encephalitozoon cuniculi GB-M1]AGE95036.1 hypothetical protein ECU08_0530 [Encephalitozoon cuniculi]KMV65580.1 sulfate permease-like protein [Encephalitozoon cuniculi EcunIII-L]UYI26980.1 sulfate transporter protein [Encephalitozoon cuniculi]CAD26358.1 similarity to HYPOTHETICAL INTEGRAL MEMBRANE PROTEIN YG35_yeast [Encephalitozoon cuniculi GB-M1]
MKSEIKTTKQRILSLVSSSFLILIITSLDFLSFGAKLLNPEKSHSRSVRNVSAVMFLYSTIGAQFIFGLFSGLGGVCAGAIFEAQRDTRKIHEVCFRLSDSFGEEIFTTYVCIFLSTALYAFFSYILKVFRIGNYLRYIPIPALYGVMVSIGMMSVECGYEETYSITWKHVHACFAVTICLALLALVLDIVFPAYFLMIPMFSFTVFVAFYGVFMIAGKDVEWMRSVNLVPKTEGISLDPLEVMRHFRVENIRMEAVWANWWNILGLSLFNLVHIAVNIPSFVESLGMKAADLNKELGVQSIGNAASAFLGYPTYFICSTSIYFNKSGGRTRIHSLAGVAAISSLLVIGKPIRESIPVILSATIPMFIGFGFLYSYLWLPMFKLSWMDLLTLVTSALVSWYLTPICGLVFGIALNSFYIIVQRLSTRLGDAKAELEPNETVGLPDGMGRKETYRVVDVAPMVLFGDLCESAKAMKGLYKENILFDLRRCGHFGANANMALEDMIETIAGNGYKTLIVGSPTNLYTHLFSRYMIDLQ